jgi:hypothetical protein
VSIEQMFFKSVGNYLRASGFDGKGQHKKQVYDLPFVITQCRYLLLRTPAHPVSPVPLSANDAPGLG